MSEDDLDAVAREICRDVKQEAERKSKLEHEAAAYGERVATSWLRWLAPLRRRWESHQVDSRTAATAIERRMAGALDELVRLAHDRYYVSEWFQATRIPLVMRNSQGKIDCELAVSYTKDGAFQLKGKGISGSGYDGEFSVFEALRKRVADPGSPLFGARLLPNLFLPHDGSERDMRAGRWNQVDCVVATAKGAFVIETKRWRARVSTISSYSQLYVARDTVDGGMYKPVDNALRQVERAARAFEIISPYPEDCIYRALVFARPREFNSDVDDFVGQMLISWCEADSGPFVGAIERALEGLDPIMDEDELNSWADDVLAGFGDLRGSYRERAQEARLRERKRTETHPKPSKGTRSKSARKHYRQKHFRDRKGGNKRKQTSWQIDEDEWGW